MSVVRYAPWQALDFALDRGRSALVVVALFWLQAVLTLRSTSAGDRGQVGAAMFQQMIPLLGFILVIFAVNGIVAGDRKSGTFRMLLGKPVSAASLYGQAFVINGLGTVALGALFAIGYALAAGSDVPTGGAMLYVALYYLVLGGIGFALSTIARLDWASTTAVWVGALLVRSVLPMDRSWYGPLLDAIIPPTDAIASVGETIMAGAAFPMLDAARAAGYGAVAFALGMGRLLRHPFDE